MKNQLIRTTFLAALAAVSLLWLADSNVVWAAAETFDWTPAAPADRACNSQNCRFGCCDGGACHTEESTDYCGLHGVDCVACGPANPNCRLGMCVGCNFVTCPYGCCDADNYCHPDDNEQYCGLAGASCEQCGGANPVCFAGSCQGCDDIATCPSGCCNTNTGRCHSGDGNNECGAVGDDCVNCQLSGHVCQNHICVAPDDDDDNDDNDDNDAADDDNDDNDSADDDASPSDDDGSPADDDNDTADDDASPTISSGSNSGNGCGC